MNLPRTYQEEQWIKGGRRPEYKRFIGKPVISWTQVEGWTAKRGFNTRTSPGRKEYIRKYFLGEEFKDKGWREFGTDVEDYITTRNKEAAQKFTIEEVSTLDQIEPLGVFQDEIVIDFGSFCLLGYIDDYTPPDHNKRVRVLRDYKTKSENSKKDLHQKDKFQLELYILGLQQRGLYIERAEYVIIERLGGRDCMNGKGRNSLSVGSRIWNEEYHFDQASIDRAQSVVKKVAQEISDYYTLFQRINGVKNVKSNESSELDKSPQKSLRSGAIFTKKELTFLNLEESLEITRIRELYVKGNNTKNEVNIDSLLLKIKRLTNLRKLTLRGVSLKLFPLDLIKSLSLLHYLDLSKNHISEISCDWESLSHLEHLDLSWNKLTQIPIPRITEHCEIFINYIDLSYNRLTSIPPEIAFIGVTELYLRGNRLDLIPWQIGILDESLEILDLGDNDLTSIPPEIGELFGLYVLRLDGNKLAAIPLEIGHLGHLHTLDLSNNNLCDLPFEIQTIGVYGELTAVDLYLSNNNFKSISTSTLPGELDSLRLDGNQLSKVPLGIEDLRLGILDLSKNHIENIASSEILSLKGINKLYLSENNLTSIPSEIGNLRELQHLDLTKNNLTSIPSEIGNLRELKHLNLTENNLTSIPSEIGNLRELKHLNLTRNNLTSIPSEIRQLRNLKELDLSFNNLTSIPSEIGDLEGLLSLVLTGNGLSSIPSEIGKLEKLESFSFAGNKVSIIPSEICKLSNLTILQAGNNSLDSIPSEVGSLGKLSRLSLSHNKLTSLPPEIGHLVNLKFFSMSNNKITSLPPEIGNLRKLEDLWADGNNFESVPIEILTLTSLQRLLLDGKFSKFHKFFKQHLPNCELQIR